MKYILDEVRFIPIYKNFSLMAHTFHKIYLKIKFLVSIFIIVFYFYFLQQLFDPTNGIKNISNTSSNEKNQNFIN